MPFCMNCGQEIPEGANFCASCGTATGTIKKEEPQRKNTYDGEIHKCPNCGEVLNSFMPNCPSCGYEIRTVNSSNSPVNELARRIENATSLELKIELITNFYVPNTKEDIYEFFILAVSNLEDTYYDTDDAWQAKLEQTYHKAKLLFGNTPEFEYIDELYKKTNDHIAKRGLKTFIRKNSKLIIRVIAFLLGLFLILSGAVYANIAPVDESGNVNYGGTVILCMVGMLIMGFSYLSSITFDDNEENEDKMKNKVKRASVDLDKLKGTEKETVDSIRQSYADIAEQFGDIN